MAIIWATGLKIGIYLTQIENPAGFWLVYTSQAGILINIWLMVLNLIPIPPLDGSRVVASLLATKAAQLYSRIEPFGFIILMVLIFTNVIQAAITPPTLFIVSLLSQIFNLPL